MNWVSMAIGAAITALAGFGLHSIDVNRINAKHATAMTELSRQLKSECTTAKATTMKVSNEYQSNLAVLDSDFSDLNGLLTSSRCAGRTGLDASTVAGFHGTAAAEQFDKGIAAAFEPQRVTGIVRKGEKYRIQLLACQAWANQTWQIAQQQK